jgi:hypothetical protein
VVEDEQEDVDLRLGPLAVVSDEGPSDEEKLCSAKEEMGQALADMARMVAEHDVEKGKLLAAKAGTDRIPDTSRRSETTGRKRPRDALDRTRRRAEERSGVHTEAALQLLASRHGLRGFL